MTIYLLNWGGGGGGFNFSSWFKEFKSLIHGKEENKQVILVVQWTMTVISYSYKKRRRKHKYTWSEACYSKKNKN